MKNKAIKTPVQYLEIPFCGPVAEVEVRYKTKPEFPISERAKITKSSLAVDLFRSMYAYGTMELREEFWALYLNQSMKPLACCRIGLGGVASVVADPKTIFQTGLLLNAVGIIICHNHPSGNLEPSREDDNLTARCVQAGTFLKMDIVDHVIITQASYFSYKENGKI
jgi:DNA repair protein RadC